MKEGITERERERERERKRERAGGIESDEGRRPRRAFRSPLRRLSPLARAAILLGEMKYRLNERTRPSVCPLFVRLKR